MADSYTPGWYPDPEHKHELRYHDGQRWTKHVSNAGVVSEDALPGVAETEPTQAMPTHPVGTASVSGPWDAKATQLNNRKWYRRPVVLVLAVVVALVLLGGIVSAATGSKSASSPHATAKALVTTTTTRAPVTTTTLPPTTTTTVAPTTATTAPPPPPTTQAPAIVAPPPTQSCPNGGYVNSSGNYVCSPYTPSGGGVPAGATAKCNDGTYSFSQHRQGTCSGHGGVAQWLAG